MFNGWLRAYEWSLDKVLKAKAVMLLVTAATLVGTVWLYIVIPKGFFPIEDTGFVFSTVEGPSDISFKAMLERMRAVADIVRKDPAVEYIQWTAGTGGPNPTNNQGRIFIALKPKKERNNVTQVIQRLRRDANT